jgi:hypothetical protein
MAEKKHGEKSEKGEKQEKETEKEEKYTKDPISAIFIGFVVIAVGIVLYFANEELYGVSWENAWNYVLMGVGCAFLLSALLHTVIPQYRKPIMGEVVFGAILLVVGGASQYEPSWWPLILIAGGVLAILYGITKMRRT